MKIAIRNTEEKEEKKEVNKMLLKQNETKWTGRLRNNSGDTRYIFFVSEA